MSHKIESKDPFDFITRDEAKAQCRLTPGFTLDDSEIDALILAASDMAQQFTNLLLTTGVVTHYTECYKSNGFMVFGGNVTAINEVKASINDTEETLPVEAYSLNPVTGDISVSADYSGYTDFYFNYNCGYVSDQIPKGIKHAVLRMISTLYNHREDVAVGQEVEKMPHSSKIILGMYRRYVS